MPFEKVDIKTEVNRQVKVDSSLCEYIEKAKLDYLLLEQKKRLNLSKDTNECLMDK